MDIRKLALAAAAAVLALTYPTGQAVARQTAATGSSAAPAVAAAATTCAGPLVDDFSSGTYDSHDWTSGILDNTKTGTMLGGYRFTRFNVPTNTYGFPAGLKINTNGDHLLVASSGYGTFAFLQVFYGLKAAGVAAPLHADLSCYGRFRVTYKGSDLSTSALVIVYYLDPVTHGGRYGTCQKVIPSGAFNGSVVDFPYSCFKDGAGRPVADWSDITQIGLLVNPNAGAIGGHDYAISKIELLTGCGQLICL